MPLPCEVRSFKLYRFLDGVPPVHVKLLHTSMQHNALTDHEFNFKVRDSPKYCVAV